MKISFVSIFPDIYKSFLETSLIAKGIDKGILEFEVVNPRDFSEKKHKQVDDEIYGGGQGMLIMAKPLIDAVNSIVDKLENNNFKIIYLAPSEIVFNQKLANQSANVEHLIVVSGRYEGIDKRFEDYFVSKYPNNFKKISLGNFVIMGGEVASMVLVEAVTRLVPGIINDEASHLFDSYSITKDMKNIEHPNYTRPYDVYGMKVPDVLLSGHDAKIQQWKDDNEIKI